MTEFKRVFVDTAPIIYYLENSSLYMDVIKKFFTNDKQLRQEKELPCMTMEDLEKYLWKN